MKFPESGGDIYVIPGEELPISGAAMMELLGAVVDKDRPFRFRARGFSMSPFIKDNDVITVLPLAGEPRLGEVVAFRHPVSQRLVVHRVVGKGPGIFRIRGDAVPQDDGMISRDDILGRVAAVERNGKPVRLGMGPERALIAFVTRTGLFLNVIMPLWMLIRPIVRPNRRST